MEPAPTGQRKDRRGGAGHLAARGAWKALALIGAGLGAATLVGLFGSLGWIPDLLSNFRVQYFAGLLALTLVFAAGRKRRTTASLGLCLAINAWLLVPYYLGGHTPPGSADVRIVSMNVHIANPDRERVAAYIRETNPDILLLMEVDDAWIAGLQDALASYPTHVEELRGDAFGMALYTRTTCDGCAVTHFADMETPAVTGFVDLGGRRTALLAAHPLPPVTRQWGSARDIELDAMASYLAEQETPRILVGDLNGSPWSAAVRHLLTAASMVDSARGFGVQLSWPVYAPLQRVPIDNCLVSPDLAVTRRELGHDVGSDHYPILVDIALAAPGGE